jgi:hypothetical protein
LLSKLPSELQSVIHRVSLLLTSAAPAIGQPVEQIEWAA